MNASLHSLACLVLFFSYGAAMVGCGDKPAGSQNGDAVEEGATDHSDHDHSDHSDHSEHDHSEHDHPEHGQHGGHLIQMSNDQAVEVQFADDEDTFTVYVDDVEASDGVTKVVMKTDIAGNETEYDFQAGSTDAGNVFTLTSPGLSTAVKMGEAVTTTLVITTPGGEYTGRYKHHSH